VHVEVPGTDVVEEHDLWDLVEKLVVAPSNPVFLADHKKKMAKAK
jgi:hypothetical protein